MKTPKQFKSRFAIDEILVAYKIGKISLEDAERIVNIYIREHVEDMTKKLKTTGKVLTPDNEHVRQYLSDAKKGRKLRKK